MSFLGSWFGGPLEGPTTKALKAADNELDQMLAQQLVAMNQAIQQAVGAQQATANQFGQLNQPGLQAQQWYGNLGGYTSGFGALTFVGGGGVSGVGGSTAEPVPITPLPAPTEPPFFGYRCWNLAPEEAPILKSCTREVLWLDPILKADLEPTEWSNAGIYCYRSAVNALAYNGAVVGRIRCYGTVVEHEAGFRASHAVIECLVVPQREQPPSQEWIKALEQRYQCPVTVVKGMHALIAALEEGICSLVAR